MNFISIEFIILLLGVLLLRIYFVYSNNKSFIKILLFSGVVFYGYHVPFYLLILFLTTGIDFISAKLINKNRKYLLFFSILINLLILIIFKYYNFFADQLGYSNLLINLVMPIGISFYTFEAISYMIDVYKGKIKPEKNYLNYMSFILFFPHLVAGPIIRASNFLVQLNRRRRFCFISFSQGVYLILLGVFLKVCCADAAGEIVDKHWNIDSISTEPRSGIFLLIILFSIQIFCDFAGYSNIAIGCSYILGYKLPINFLYPYVARSFTEFWHHWHISLSHWIRDYLYIPLGGDNGNNLRKFIVLLTVWMICGIWHGAAVTFLLWGSFFGIFIFIERLIGFTNPKNINSLVLLYAIFVQLVILFLWVLFRSENLKFVLTLFENLIFNNFKFSDSKIIYNNFTNTLILNEKNIFFLDNLSGAFVELLPLLSVLVYHLYGGYYLYRNKSYPKINSYVKSLLCGLFLFLIISMYAETSKFIYFQF